MYKDAFCPAAQKAFVAERTLQVTQSFYSFFILSLLLILRPAPVSASPTWIVQFDLSGYITAVNTISCTPIPERL